MWNQRACCCSPVFADAVRCAAYWPCTAVSSGRTPTTRAPPRDPDAAGLDRPTLPGSPPPSGSPAPCPHTGLSRPDSSPAPPASPPPTPQTSVRGLVELGQQPSDVALAHMEAVEAGEQGRDLLHRHPMVELQRRHQMHQVQAEPSVREDARGARLEQSAAVPAIPPFQPILGHLGSDEGISSTPRRRASWTGLSRLLPHFGPRVTGARTYRSIRSGGGRA